MLHFWSEPLFLNVHEAHVHPLLMTVPTGTLIKLGRSDGPDDDDDAEAPPGRGAVQTWQVFRVLLFRHVHDAHAHSSETTIAVVASEPRAAETDARTSGSMAPPSAFGSGTALFAAA